MNFNLSTIFSDLIISLISVKIKMYLMGTVILHKIFMLLIQDD